MVGEVAVEVTGSESRTLFGWVASKGIFLKVGSCCGSTRRAAIYSISLVELLLSFGCLVMSTVAYRKLDESASVN